MRRLTYWHITLTESENNFLLLLLLPLLLLPLLFPLLLPPLLPPLLLLP